MNITVLNACDTQLVLKRLITEHREIQICVAWGYNGELADTLLSNRKKFQSVIFGLNGFSTSPDLVERLIDVPNAFIAKSDNGIFHPKLYLFRTGDKADAIVGSANFTKGGLERNHELSLHLTGSCDDEIFAELQREASIYDIMKRPVTPILADSYRRQYIAAKRQRGPRDPLLPNEGNGFEGFTSPLALMTWEEFSTTARTDPYHSLARRLSLLREIQRMFAGAQYFSDLSLAQWKAIAGTMRPAAKEAKDLEPHEWGWFGSMYGNGRFASLISRQNQQLGIALDCIPRTDPVTKQDFEEYCRRFSQAFEAEGTHDVSKYFTATRLLAMKRPDTFVCINGRNRRSLADALGFAPTALSLANYWDWVIVPVQSSVWYNAPRPIGNDSELWDYRVAMLDSIYYTDPS